MDLQITKTEALSEFLKSKHLFEFVGLVTIFFTILSFMCITSNKCTTSAASIFRSYISVLSVFYLLFLILFGSDQVDYSIQLGFFNIGPLFLLFYLICISGFLLKEEEEVMEIEL